MKKIPFDFIFATLLCIAASYGTVFSYSRIAAPVGERSFDALREGETKYSVLQQGECVGDFRYDLKSEADAFKLEFEGEARLSYEAQLLKPRIEVEFSFSKFGQLSSTVGALYLDKEKIRFGTVGINPIKLIIRGGSSAQPWEREFTFRGPVELLKSRDGTWGVAFDHSDELFGAIQNLERQPLFERTGLNVVQDESDGKTCAASLKSFNLTPLVTFAVPFLREFTRLTERAE